MTFTFCPLSLSYSWNNDLRSYDFVNSLNGLNSTVKTDYRIVKVVTTFVCKRFEGISLIG